MFGVLAHLRGVWEDVAFRYVALKDSERAGQAQAPASAAGFSSEGRRLVARAEPQDENLLPACLTSEPAGPKTPHQGQWWCGFRAQRADEAPREALRSPERTWRAGLGILKCTSIQRTRQVRDSGLGLHS